jgi:hypothetical protein
VADVELTLKELKRDVAEQKAWERWQAAADRRTLRDLRRQLAEERTAREPAEEEFLTALRSFDSHASDSEVADRCYRGRLTQSARVRVGLALSRLEASGRAARVPVKTHGSERNRWEAVDA